MRAFVLPKDITPGGPPGMPPPMRRVSQETKSRPMPMGTASIQIISLMPPSAAASYSRCFCSRSWRSCGSPCTRIASQGSSADFEPSAALP